MKLDSIYPEPNIRKWVQKKSLPHALYVLLAFAATFLLLLIWGVLALSYNNSLGFFAIIVGFANGFIAYLFMHFQNRIKLMFYSAAFTTLSVIFLQYFYYSHFINWQLGLIVNKDHLNFALLFQYLGHFGGINEAAFFKNLIPQMSNFDIVCWFIGILFSRIYILFSEDDDDANDDTSNKTSDATARIIRKKFNYRP